jgi:nifR3 family TIM-barrel protein
LYHSVTIGTLKISGNLFLAPVAGYTDRSFRAICIEQGANFTCTELVSSQAIVRNSIKTTKLLQRAENEQKYAIQLFGAEPGIMAKAVSQLELYHPSVIDINCGCPVPKVIKTGSGAALHKNPELLGKIVDAVVKASNSYLCGIPVTVKIRSGWDNESLNYKEVAHIAVEAGACLVSLHARTRAQGYSGKANWEHIGDLAAYLSVPVAGSGDVYTPEDAQRMLKETNCSVVLFARGAIENPFVFKETKKLLETGSYVPVGTEEKLQVAFRQLLLRVTDVGEELACKEMRKQFCAYTKGLPDGARIRNTIVHAKSILEYQSILSDSLNGVKSNYS